jgi:hypothetical protein
MFKLRRRQSYDFDLRSFISGGYRLVKSVRRPIFNSKPLLPEQILSTSTCITDTLPDQWALNWINEENTARKEKAKKFGVTEEQLPSLIEWITLQIDKNRMGFPNIFLSTADAKDFLKKFNLASNDVVLIGIGIHIDVIEELIESASPLNLMDGLVHTIARRGPLEQKGEFLGFEIYGHEMGAFHSWLCNGLEEEASKQFGIRPNHFGFLDNYWDALKCSKHFEKDEVGAEPVPWLPWAIVRYPL